MNKSLSPWVAFKLARTPLLVLALLSMLGLALTVAVMAQFDQGVDFRVRNTIDRPVDMYWWQTAGTPPQRPELKLGPKQETMYALITSKPRSMNLRVEARDASGTLLFCRIYTWEDRVSDRLWEVVIVEGRNSCPQSG